MSEHLDRFGDAAVAVVTFTPAHQVPDRLAAHRRHLGVPFPILSDPTLDAYHRFGFGRGSRRQVWNPGTLALYGRLLRRGRRLERSDQDIRQLGGDVVLDAEGIEVEVFRPPSPDARPSIDALVAAVERAR
ncbi:MAG: AhpC/TSA family protein [Acidimicrobiales bacterium]